MRNYLPFFLIALLIVSASSCVNKEKEKLPENEVAKTQPWARHCTMDGIVKSSEDREFWEKYATRCSVQDACILSCVRSGCAFGVGGGCWHSCSYAKDLAKSADAYETKTEPYCKWQRPNKSLKDAP